MSQHRYRVMCTQETGEEACHLSDVSYDEAHNWISENADGFPESKFFVELMEDRMEYHQDLDDQDMRDIY